MFIVEDWRLFAHQKLIAWRRNFSTPVFLYGLLISLIYVGFAKFGLSLAETTSQVTAVWPATGFALVVLVLGGFRYWPAIYLGALVANLLTNEPLLVAMVIAAGNTFEAVAGTYLLKRFLGFSGHLDSVDTVLGFVVAAGFISTLISASIGTTALAAGQLINWDNYSSVWLVWWVGDMMGNLIFASFLFILLGGKLIPSLFTRPLEWVVLIVGTTTLSLFVFSGQESVTAGVDLPYLLFPLVIWSALRFQELGAVVSIFIIGFVAILGTLNGTGPFVKGDTLEQNLIYLHVYLAVTAITGMILGAIIAERKQAERRLIERSHDLERSQARLLNVMDKRREAESQRDRLVAAASHELKTPLTSAYLFTELLVRNLKTTAPNQLAGEYAGRIASSLEQLTRLTSDFIDVSRFRTGKLKLDFSRVNVDRLITETVTDMRLLAKRRELIISGLAGRTIKADEIRLRQVLVNLLRNAIKHSAPGSKIIVSAGTDRDFLTVRIQNFGQPIPKKERDRIFEPFYQVSRGSKAQAGLGLGLYIVKQIIDLHSGRVWVESSRRDGTAFVFRLPLV